MNTESKTGKITACFSGSGVQAYAYFVDDDFIERWGLEKPNQDGIYTSKYDHTDLFAESDVDCLLICHGLREDADFRIDFDDQNSQGSAQGSLSKNSVAHKNVEFLKDEFLVPDGMYLIVELTKYTHGKLYAEIEIEPDNIDVKDLVLTFRNLDSIDDIFDATLRTGLIGNISHDIIELHYKENISTFELNIIDESDVELYLLQKDSLGRWMMLQRILTGSH